MADSRKLIGGHPVIGIRPIIDGRKGPLDVRGSLEEQTMSMARRAKELFEELRQQRAKGAERLRPDELSDLQEIEIDASFPIIDQVVLLLKQTSNPFYYRCDGMIIRISEAGERLINSIMEEILFGRGDMDE